MATQYAVQMALCIECSPAVQEVPGSIPAETQHSQMLHAKDVDGSGQASTVYWILIHTGKGEGEPTREKVRWATVHKTGSKIPT